MNIPTAVKLKNPCFHLPMYKARSFKQNSPGSQLAIFGLTINMKKISISFIKSAFTPNKLLPDSSSPEKCRRVSGCHSAGEWKRW